MRRTVLAAGLLCLAGLRPSAETASDPGVHASLRLAGTRTSFISGEPIRLELLVTADRPGYVIDVEGPEKAADDLSVTPVEGVHLLRSRIFSDVIVPRELSTTPEVVPLTVNYWARFDRAGDYTVRVTTRRVGAKERHGWARDTSQPPLVLETDDVTFHVDVLDEVGEQYLVGPALARIAASASADLHEQIQAAEQLAFLPGDAAAQAKYRAYTELAARSPSNARFVIERGFAVSRHPSLILEAFERELADTSRPIDAQSIAEATNVRMLVEHRDDRRGTPTFGREPDYDTDPWFLTERRYAAEAAATLPARTGRNRLDSAIALMGVPGPARPTGALDIVLDGFMQLPIEARYDLMIGPLSEVRDRRLTDALARSIGEAGPAHVSALIEALIERDPAAAAAPAVAALGNPAVIVLRSTIDKMPAGRLVAAGPGIVAALRTLAAASVERNRFRIEQKAQALALVADGAVLADARSFYEAHRSALSREARAHLIAYLARWDEKNGPSLLRDAVMADGSLIDPLSRSTGLPGFDQLCRDRLFDDDVDVATAAAVALRTVGTGADRAPIEQRLLRWREAFRSRGGDESRSDGDAEAALFTAATEGRQWRLAGDAWQRLHDGCLTDRCRAIAR